MPFVRLTTLIALLLPLGHTVVAQYALGVGATIPTGNFGDAARPGWMLAAGWSPWAATSPAVRLWLQGYYGENAAADANQSASSLAMAGIGLSFKPLPASVKPSPYLIGALGYLRHRNANGASYAMYVGAGAGIAVRRHWLQARYQVARPESGSLGFVLVAAGTSF